MCYHCSVSLPPLTTLYCFWSVLTCIVLLRYFCPIGREDGAARCLVALYHGTLCVIIDKVVHLLEGIIYATSWRRLFLFFFDFSCHCIPVCFLFVEGGGIGGCSSSWLRWSSLNSADPSITDLEEAPVHFFFCLFELDIDALC